MGSVRAHVIVTGDVQGVFYRHTAAKRARAKGLTGWIRNLPDGRVEVVVEGEEQAVRDFVEWCRSGPPHASVEDIEVSWGPPKTDSSGFNVL